jgi:hypothetical protein
MTDQAPIKKKRGPKPGQIINRMRPFQKKAIALFTEQALSGVYKPIEETLLEAGYAPESARQMSNVIGGIRAHVDPIVDEMEQHRRRVLERMKTEVEKATYGELVRSLDVSTRNIRLLSGKSTQVFELQAEHRHRLDILIEQ